MNLFLFTIVVLISTVHPATAADWSSNLGSDWSLSRIDPHVIVISNTATQDIVWISKSKSNHLSTGLPIEHLQNELNKIGSELGLPPLSLAILSSGLIQGTYEVQNTKLRSVQRREHHEGWDITVTIAAAPETSARLLKIIPKNPFAAGRDPASMTETEASDCTSCAFQNPDDLAKRFFTSVKNQLKLSCNPQAQSEDKAYLVKAIDTLNACVAGIDLGVADMAYGLYQLLSFLTKSLVSEKNNTEVASRMGLLAVQALQHPSKFLGKIWGLVKTGVEKHVTEFASCGLEFQINTICRFVGQAIVPGGLLYKWIHKSKAIAASAGTLEATVTTGIAEELGATSSSKAPKKSRVKTSTDPLVDPAEIERLSQIERGPSDAVLRAEANDFKSILEVLSQKNAKATKNLARKKNYSLLSDLRKEALKDRADLSQDKIYFKDYMDRKIIRAKKFEETAPFLIKELEARGVRAELVAKPINVRPFANALDQAEVDYRLAVGKKKPPLEVIELEIARDQARLDYEHVLKLNADGAITDYALRVDLASNPSLAKYKDLWRLNNIEYTILENGDANFNRGSRTIRINAATALAEQGIQMSDFRHELFHLKESFRGSAGTTNAPDIIFNKYEFFGSYSENMFFEELGAFQRSMEFARRGLVDNLTAPDPVTRLKEAIFYGDRMKVISDNTSKYLSDALDALDNGQTEMSAASFTDVFGRSKKQITLTFRNAPQSQKSMTINLPVGDGKNSSVSLNNLVRNEIIRGLAEAKKYQTYVDQKLINYGKDLTKAEVEAAGEAAKKELERQSRRELFRLKKDNDPPL